MTHIFTKDEDRAWQLNLPAKRCSAALALIDSDMVLVVKATYKAFWTLPSGIVERGESPLTAALRETAEEVGIQLEPEQVEFETVVYSPPSDGFLDRFSFVFRASCDQQCELRLQAEEIEAAQWVPIASLAELSGHRPSYQRIQASLLGTHEPYQEAVV